MVVMKVEGSSRSSIVTVRFERRNFGELQYHGSGEFIGLDVYKVVGKDKFGIDLFLPDKRNYELGSDNSASRGEIMKTFYKYVELLSEGKAIVQLDYPKEGLARILKHHNNL